MIRLHAHPPPHPLSLQQIVSLFHSSYMCHQSSLLTVEGAGVEPNHTTARELGPSINRSIFSGYSYIYWNENTYVMAVSIMFLSARWWFKSCSSISGCRWVTSFGCGVEVYILVLHNGRIYTVFILFIRKCL